MCEILVSIALLITAFYLFFDSNDDLYKLNYCRLFMKEPVTWPCLLAQGPPPVHRGETIAL